jgi:hypothetical protein
MGSGMTRYRKYQPAEPEYEVYWRVSEANESQTSYSVEQADIFQNQSYSHLDDILIILISTINTDTSIFVIHIQITYTYLVSHINNRFLLIARLKTSLKIQKE